MISAHHSHCAAPMARHSRPSVLARLKSAISLHHQRARLAQLDDAALSDIGLTRAQALQEARRPFWDAPSHWMN